MLHTLDCYGYRLYFSRVLTYFDKEFSSVASFLTFEKKRCSFAENLILIQPIVIDTRVMCAIGYFRLTNQKHGFLICLLPQYGIFRAHLRCSETGAERQRTIYSDEKS